jgi:cell division protein FtsB
MLLDAVIAQKEATAKQNEAMAKQNEAMAKLIKNLEQQKETFSKYSNAILESN